MLGYRLLLGVLARRPPPGWSSARWPPRWPALWVGDNIGLGTYNHLLASSATGASFHASLALGAKSALALWPLCTSGVILLAESGGRRTAIRKKCRVRHVDRRTRRNRALRRLGG